MGKTQSSNENLEPVLLDSFSENFRIHHIKIKQFTYNCLNYENKCIRLALKKTKMKHNRKRENNN